MRIVVDRPVIALLALLGAGGVSVALADPPATHDSASPAAVPAAPATSTAVVSPPAAAAAAADANASATAPAKETGAALEKRLTNSGYKPRMRNGTKVWCKRQDELGSRLGAQEVCGTPDELMHNVQRNQDFVEQIQKVGAANNPTGR